MNESAAETDLGEGTLGVSGWAAIASVGLALYHYYVRGDKQRGQSIGLWPATTPGLATHPKTKQVRQESKDHDHE